MPAATYWDQTMHGAKKERPPDGILRDTTFYECPRHYLGLFVGALSSVTFSSISLTKEKQRYMSERIGSYIVPVSL